MLKNVDQIPSDRNVQNKSLKVAFSREKTAVTKIYSRIQNLADSWLFKHSYLI